MMISDQLKAAVLKWCVFSSALKLMRDEADCTLLGRRLQTFITTNATYSFISAAYRICCFMFIGWEEGNPAIIYDIKFHQINYTSDFQSLPDVVVTAPSLNIFKNRLDKHWINHDVLYVWHAEILGTGSRSNIFS